jgi:hypothetical protein
MTESNKFSAGGSLTGYLFQCRIALLRGLELARKNPGGAISIEKFDDVSFETEDLSLCLIQAKHHISPKSLDNKSVDVWKTLRIWIEGFNSGVFQAQKTKYFLITTATATEGSALALLREGCSASERMQARDILRDAASESENKDTAKARSLFLDLTDEEANILLGNIVVLDQHPNLTNVMGDIEAELLLLAPKKAEMAAEYLEGWWLNIVGKHLVKQQNSTIPVQNIVLKAHEIGKILQEDNLPIDKPSALGIKEYTEDDEKRIFVRQMRAINLPDQHIQNSAYDYYRAYAQRSRWSRESLILEDELGEYDEKLRDSWRRKFDAELLTVAPKSDEEKLKLGRALFLWASQESVALRNIVEKWITAGSYHGLADQRRVGWHPEFEKLFAEEKELEDA